MTSTSDMNRPVTMADVEQAAERRNKTIRLQQALSAADGDCDLVATLEEWWNRVNDGGTTVTITIAPYRSIATEIVVAVDGQQVAGALGWKLGNAAASLLAELESKICEPDDRFFAHDLLKRLGLAWDYEDEWRARAQAAQNEETPR